MQEAVPAPPGDIRHAALIRLACARSCAHDELPFIGTHRNDPHHLFALGLGTNLTSVFLASRILVRAVQGASEKSDQVLRVWTAGGEAVNERVGAHGVRPAGVLRPPVVRIHKPASGETRAGPTPCAPTITGH